MGVLNGQTVEERLHSAELIIEKLLRKPEKKSKVAVPPVVMTLYAKSPTEGSEIGRAVFPFDCKIRFAKVMIAGAGKDGAVVSASVRDGMRVVSESFNVKGNKSIVEVEEEVKEDSQLTLTFEGGTAEHVWVVIVADPKLKDLKLEELNNAEAQEE